MNIREKKEVRDNLTQKLGELVKSDSYSRREESELREQIKKVNRELALEEIQLRIKELEIKVAKGEEGASEKLTQNKLKLEMLNNG